MGRQRWWQSKASQKLELTPIALEAPRGTLASRTFWNDGNLSYINLVAISYIWLVSI